MWDETRSRRLLQRKAENCSWEEWGRRKSPPNCVQAAPKVIQLTVEETEELVREWGKFPL